MPDSSDSPSILQRAVEQLLRPLVRLLLRHSVSFAAFEEMAKRVYVDTALKDFTIPGRKPSASRVAVLTGLTRKEVQRLLLAAPAAGDGLSERYNRAARVLTGWARDADFLDRQGEARELELDGEYGFAALVRRYSGDMPARAVLDELLRVGAVEQREQLLHPTTRAFVPQRGLDDKIGILGRDTADLIATIDHNLQHANGDARFQRKVMYHAIPVNALPAFRRASAADAQALLEKLDRWLAAHDIDDPPAATTPLERARVGLGIYYFEERLEEPAEREGVSR